MLIEGTLERKGIIPYLLLDKNGKIFFIKLKHAQKLRGLCAVGCAVGVYTPRLLWHSTWRGKRCNVTVREVRGTRITMRRSWVQT